jgi:hypothetical protein
MAKGVFALRKKYFGGYFGSGQMSAEKFPPFSLTAGHVQNLRFRKKVV